jgi:hypothetical protein
MTDQEFSCVNAACRSLGEHHPLCQYKPAPTEVAQGEAVAWLCTHFDGRRRVELPGLLYDQDAGWGASRVPLYTAPPSPDLQVAQGEAVHQWEFADAWMDTDEAGAASARCEGYKTRIVYTAPQHDAELMELLQRLRSMYRRGDLDVWTCVDAKLASLRP